MSNNCYDFLDDGIEDVDPKLKFNSLLSVTISTIMCISAKCPLPKSNVETTTLFLRTITDENGEVPRNINGFLSLLNNYEGPYENDLKAEKGFEKPSPEKPTKEKETKVAEEGDTISEASSNQIVLREATPISEVPVPVKRIPKLIARKAEKEAKKVIKSSVSRISTSKSILSKF